jgi:lipoate-protein ligase B
MTLETKLDYVSSKMACQVYYLGIMDYMRSCRLQEHLRDAIDDGQLIDSILVLQHPPVLSVGKSGYQPEHLLRSYEQLEREHIPICQTNRGGGITYHGPGQLVFYPIFDLRHQGISVRQYISNLEEVVIDSLSYFSIEARRFPGMPGVWAGNAEISSVGIHVSRGISIHGFTLNVNNDLKYFSYISACGVAGKKITSITEISGSRIQVESVIPTVISSFSRVFNLDIAASEIESVERYHD